MDNKIVIFISGRGSNAKNIINYFSDNSDLQVSHVFSNNKHSDFVNHLKNTNVQYFLFEEDEINGKVFKELKTINPKLIILAGFLKKIPLIYINFFKNKIINIHPSLLPKYKGLNTHHRALKAKEKFSGCTIHYVSKKLDSGKIIAQKKVKILKKDNIKKLEKRVLKEENKLYPIVLEKLIMS